ncbi:hypothetical protein PG989_003034 [Apiospora arundinis]
MCFAISQFDLAQVPDLIRLPSDVLSLVLALEAYAVPHVVALARHDLGRVPDLGGRVAVVGRVEGDGEVVVNGACGLDDGRLRVARLGHAALAWPRDVVAGATAAASGALVEGEFVGGGLAQEQAGGDRQGDEGRPGLSEQHCV